MRILIISDSFPPEVRSASLLMYELAQGLVENNHNVSVLTTYPQYNLAEKDKVYPAVEIEEGVTVIRAKTAPIHNVNFIVKGIGQVLLPLILYGQAKKHLRDKCDVVFIYSPPLTLGITAIMLTRKYKAKMVINVQDIFPQNAVDLGALKSRFLIRLLERLEQYIYKKAAVITVHSEGNKQFIEGKNDLGVGKVKIVHNWIDPAPFLENNGSRAYLKEYGIDNQYVVLFAGVMGPSQGLDFIIEAAEKLQEIMPDLLFMFVGDGMVKKKLMNMVEQKALRNVTFHDFVNKEEYPTLVGSVDAGLISLTADNKTPVVPGKLLGYMAAGKPVVAPINSESDGHEIIRAAGCGYSVIHGDLDLFISAIKKLRIENNGEKMGLSGRQHLLKNYTKEICVASYEEIFQQLNCKVRVGE